MLLVSLRMGMGLEPADTALALRGTWFPRALGAAASCQLIGNLP